MKNVLLVDDHRPFLLSLSDWLGLSYPDVKVFTAGDGGEAMEIVESIAIDLLITDIVMPRVNGFELLAHMAKKHSDIPVIVMTAFESRAVQDRLNALGISKWMTKPLEIKELSERIQGLLGPDLRSD